MSDERKSEDAPRPQRPRSPRIPANFTVELEGRTTRDEPFRLEAQAERVSRGGATIVTDVHLAKGAHVRLTPPFGRALTAEVNGIWKDEKDGRQRIGIKLLDPNGWFAE